MMNNWLKSQTLSLLLAGWIKDEFRVRQTKLALPKLMNNKIFPTD